MSLVKKKIIAVHDGKFHMDELLAITLLKINPKYSKYSVIRTRELKELEKCEIVCDVGGIYNEQQLRFDHHQKGYTKT